MKNFKILTFIAIMAISMICFAGCGDKDKNSTNKDNNESSISTTVTTEDNETTNTTTETSIVTSVVVSTTNNSGTSVNDSTTTTVTTKQEPQTTKVNPTTTTTVAPEPSNPKDIGYWKDSKGNEHYFPDYNNQYVQKIYDSGLVDSSVYRGTTIVKTPTGWSVVFIGTGSNPSAPTYNLGFDTCDLDSATTSNLLSKIDSEGESYMNAVASGDLPMVDLDGNGLLSAGEARIVAIFMSGSYNFDGVYTITYITIR